MASPPIYMAARNGKIRVLQDLIKDGVSPNTTSVDGWTPLHASVFYGHIEAARILLEHGADIEAKMAAAGFRPLHKACERGFINMIDLLLAHGAEIDGRSKDGKTPLYIAASHDRVEAVQFMLDKGADPTARSNDGFTPLYIAAGNGCDQVVRVLVETGVVDVNAQANDGWGSLYYAARHGHAGVVRYLLEHGADGRAMSTEGWRPLHTAAFHGHVDVVGVLLEQENSRYALEDEITQSGYRPLHKAVAKGRVKVARMLLDAGARINAVDVDGKTPLHVAVQLGQVAAAQELLHRGAKVDLQTHKSKGRKTPLHLAIQEGNNRMLGLLRAHGADIELPDADDKTALDYAREKEDGGALLNLLQQAGSGEWEEDAVNGETMAATSAASSEGWFKRLGEFRLLLRGPIGDRSPVRIAIIDSGVEPAHPQRNMIRGYRDFVGKSESQDWQDNTGHGTTGVDLVCKVITNPAIYVARVFERSAGSAEVQDRIAKAIEYARTVWKVDIITLASGFNQPHQLMQEEIRKACHQGILIFAAASNDGNTQFITFPANLASVSEVICMFATSANAKAITSSINPSPSQRSRYNFAIFGEGLVSRPGAKPQSGTSMATFIGAATAALILDFARQSDVAEIIGSQRGAYLSSVGGMSAVFRRMAEGGSEAGYDCMAPWKLQSYFPQSRDKHKVSIAHAISDALDKSMV